MTSQTGKEAPGPGAGAGAEPAAGPDTGTVPGSGAGAGRTDRVRWEERFTEAGHRVEDELRRVMRYIDNEVVPEIRRNGSSALRQASAELERLARYMDDRRGGGPAGKP